MTTTQAKPPSAMTDHNQKVSIEEDKEMTDKQCIDCNAPGNKRVNSGYITTEMQCKLSEPCKNDI